MPRCLILVQLLTLVGSGLAFNLPVFSAAVKSASSMALGMRVAYQGEPGAYSEKSTRELLGEKVTAIGRPDFESCFRAVASMEADYACLPVENSLGGSIHENYDLMLRYDLTICAEHEFRVRHCVLVKPGVKLEDIKYAISHPQALAQCDNYLRGLGIQPIPTYDTAGSAKMISLNDLPPRCTPENTCAIASDLAGTTYRLQCLAKGVEDDDTNFTRFLLLGRKGVLPHLTKNIPAKTSVVFTLPNTAGALYKAMACFSLRDIDMSKIESRPTSASLLNYLKFRNQQNGDRNADKAKLPRFRYSFYVDFLSGQLDPNTENALSQLKEQATYVRILGSYPQKSRLVGQVKDAVDSLKNKVVDSSEVSLLKLPSDEKNQSPLNVGIVGFGSFGQVLGTKLKRKHHVSCMDQSDRSSEAKEIGVDYFPPYERQSFLKELDVVVLSVPLIDLQEAIEALPLERLTGKLVVVVSPLNGLARDICEKAFKNQPDIDILVTNTMFGSLPRRGQEETFSESLLSNSWDGSTMAYERIKISNVPRCDRYLKFFEESRCQVVEMDSDQHDSTTADAEFLTHLVGRILGRQVLPPTPVMSKEYAALNDVVELTAGESFDKFFGMYKFNERASDYVRLLRENLATVERKLAAREAYLAAKAEMKRSDRQRLLEETRVLLQELALSGRLPVSNVSEEVKIPQDEEKVETKPTKTKTK
eukprot:Nitzschia sp. Nitz4//scaffold41_size133979//82627//84811//NITZ4_003357-RA/size133979-snap-gene-0.128-mRNA-1//-1//CDS//3329551500//4189//frame0